MRTIITLIILGLISISCGKKESSNKTAVEEDKFIPSPYSSNGAVYGQLNPNIVNMNYGTVVNREKLEGKLKGSL